MIKAVIFDLDGTILYSLPDIVKAINVAHKLCDLPLVTEAQTRLVLGHGVHALIDKLAGPIKSKLKQQIYTIYQSYYERNATTDSYPYKGIIELLKYLRDQRINMGVASNKSDHIVRNICEEYFNKFIHICRGDIEGLPKKPDPDMVLDVMKQLRVTKDEVIYVGDSEPDIHVAKHLGLKHIAVSYGYRDTDSLQQLTPNILVDSVNQLHIEIERIIHGSHSINKSK